MRLGYDKDDIGATVFRHVGVSAIFDGTLIAKRNDFDARSRDAERLEVFPGGGGATVTEAEVILFSATPVAVTLEENAVSGVCVEVFLGFLELGTFAFLDTGAIEIEVNRLRAAELVAFQNQAISASREVGTCFGHTGAKVTTDTAAEAAAALTENRRIRIRPGRFFNAACEGDDGAEKSDGEGLREEVHERMESRQWLTLLSNGIASASHLSLRATDS